MRRAAVLALALLAVLAGCAAPAAPPSLPEGVTVSVFQNRFDYGERVMQIKVSNGTDAPLTVTRATLVSSRFAEPATWDRPQQIPAGGARDLKVQLPGPICDEAEPDDAVVLDFELADGTVGTARLVPADEQGRLDAVNAEDCLGASIADIVALEPPAALQWTPGAHSPAIVEITAVPTGAEGTVTIVSARSTVLLGVTDATGAPLDALPIDLVLDATAPATGIRLAVTPNRCDPHAVEEDKRGTFFPLEVSTSDGRAGTVFVAMGDDVRRGLYEFYADYCGLPG